MPNIKHLYVHRKKNMNVFGYKIRTLIQPKPINITSNKYLPFIQFEYKFAIINLSNQL